MDVTSDESVRHAAAVVERTDGHLDVLVSNAGITGPLRDAHDCTADDSAAVMATNVVGYVRVIHAFLPLLERSQDPRIVNAGSGLGSACSTTRAGSNRARAPRSTVQPRQRSICSSGPRRDRRRHRLRLGRPGRPGWNLPRPRSNALGWVPSIRGEGRVLDATDPGRLGVVDPHDVARIGALALTQDGHAGHGYILNGPQALTAREQVQTLAEVLGRPIEFVPLTPGELTRHSIEHGTPAEMAGAVQNLNELFRASRAGVLADDITNLTGLAPRTFRDWAAHHAGAFK